MINLIFYDKNLVTIIRRKIEIFFEKETSIRVYANIIWLENMYIEFSERMISINIFNKNDNWKSVIDNFLHNILDNEQVCIVYNDSIKYFEKVTKKEDIGGLFLESQTSIAPLKKLDKPILNK